MSFWTMFASCNKNFGQDDFLTIPKTPYTGDELRTDGYYYEKWDGKIYSISFFYKDGVFLDIGGRKEENEVNDYISEVSSAELPKGFWGAFLSEEKKLTIEKFVGSEKGYEVYRYEIEIANDNSFVLYESSRMKNGIKTNSRHIERKYYFKPFSPKPDSTNNFIK